MNRNARLGTLLSLSCCGLSWGWIQNLPGRIDTDPPTLRLAKSASGAVASEPLRSQQVDQSAKPEVSTHSPSERRTRASSTTWPGSESIPEWEYTFTGTVTVGNNRLALIERTGGGVGHYRCEGERIGEFRIVSIGSSEMTVDWKGRPFRVVKNPWYSLTPLRRAAQAENANLTSKTETTAAVVAHPTDGLNPTASNALDPSAYLSEPLPEFTTVILPTQPEVPEES